MDDFLHRSGTEPQAMALDFNRAMENSKSLLGLSMPVVESGSGSPDRQPDDQSGRSVLPSGDHAPVSHSNSPSAESDPQPSINDANTTERLMKTVSSAYDELHKEAATNLLVKEGSQGVIGKAINFIKNQLQLESGSTSLNRRMGEEGQLVSQLKDAADSGDMRYFTSIYKDLTGGDFDGKNYYDLKSGAFSKTFDSSQRSGVEVVTNMLAGFGSIRGLNYAAKLVPGLGGKILTGAIIGAGIKVGAKEIDGTYSNFPVDLARGAEIGAIRPISDAIFGRLIARRAAAKAASKAEHVVNAEIASTAVTP